MKSAGSVYSPIWRSRESVAWCACRSISVFSDAVGSMLRMIFVNGRPLAEAAITLSVMIVAGGGSWRSASPP